MIHVITAVHNRYEITNKFIKMLLQQSYKDIHLILVDDGSDDGTAEMVTRLMPTTTIIRGNGDLWWGGALDKAYKWVKRNDISDDDYIMISNDDVQFSREYIEDAIEHLKCNPNCLISGIGIGSESQKIIDLPIQWDFAEGKGKQIKNLNEVGNCVSTRSLFCVAGVFKKIGGFHPIFLPHYGSDYAWTIKAAKRGHEIITFENLKYEFSEGTTGLRDIKKMSRKQIFSKKSNVNPLYRLTFLIIITPWYLIPSALINQIKRIV